MDVAEPWSSEDIQFVLRWAGTGVDSGTREESGVGRSMSMLWACNCGLAAHGFFSKKLSSTAASEAREFAERAAKFGFGRPGGFIYETELASSINAIFKVQVNMPASPGNHLPFLNHVLHAIPVRQETQHVAQFPTTTTLLCYRQSDEQSASTSLD